MIDRVKIKIESNSPNRIINKLLNQNIKLYDVDITKDKLLLIVDKEDLIKLKKIKTISYQIINDYGISKGKRYIKKYAPLLLFLGFGVLLNILLSNVILEVEVNSPNKSLAQEVKNEMASYGIKKFHWKKERKEIEIIKKDYLAKSKEKIEWIEIEGKGTKYIITVEENKQKEEEKTCNPRNIIAKKNAIITKIESDSGEIIKKKQDYVEKGEVIISGFIHNKEKIVSKKCASGKVYGEVWYKAIVEIPQIIETQKKQNKFHWMLYGKIGKWKFFFPNRKQVVLEKKYNIIKNNKSAIELILLKTEEIRKEKKKYDQNTAIEKAYQEVIKQLETKNSRKPNIFQKKVLKKTIKNSKIIVEVLMAVEEEITAYQDITNIEIKEEE